MAVASSNVAYPLNAGLTSGLCSGFVFQNSRELKCLVNGIYILNWSMSLTTDTNGDTIAGQIMINNIENHTCEGSAYFQNNGRYQNVSGNTILALKIDDIIKLAVENETSVGDITVTHANLVLNKINN